MTRANVQGAVAPIANGATTGENAITNADAVAPIIDAVEQTSGGARSWRNALKIHPAAELFPLMSNDELRALGQDIKERGLRHSIVLIEGESGGDLLLDGRNRLDAMEAVGIEITNKTGFLKEEKISRRYVSKGTDPYAYVISANAHRRHLTAEQKRELIAKVLKAKPEKSNRAIGAAIKADHKTVGAVRDGLEATGEIPQLEKTTGKDGKARPATAKKATTARAKTAPSTVASAVAGKPAPVTGNAVDTEASAERRKQEAADAEPSPTTETVREVVAADEEIDLLREFARFVLDRAKSVSVDPRDHAEWKALRGHVKQVLGGGK